MAENPENGDGTQSHIPLTKDTKVGHYRIIEKIGAGGMGEVYLVEDSQLDHRVTVMSLHPHLSRDRASFARSCWSAARISFKSLAATYMMRSFLPQEELNRQPSFVRALRNPHL